MKAIVRDSCGPPEVPELGDVAKPGTGDVQVLLRVHAAGLDPSVWHLNTGVPYVVRTMFGLRRFRSPVHGWVCQESWRPSARTWTSTTHLEPTRKHDGQSNGNSAKLRR